ncbi:MAG: hypothetical protein ABJH07_00655 [Sedimentitalea sp.]|uniref:hypothetical protein n=1 Tax=Sedimentitalea sp. TaxID=2048915 RepID=UPI003262FD98
MPSITIRSAPTKARKLTKSAPYLRRQISQASANEERGRKDARAERETVTASFAKDHRDVVALIAQTERMAHAFDAAAIHLNTGTTVTKRKGLSALAAAAVRFGLPSARRKQLATLLEATAARATAVADKAQSRLDGADAELRSVAALADLSARLPGVGFDPKHPTVKTLRGEYNQLCQIAKRQRTKE